MHTTYSSSSPPNQKSPPNKTKKITKTPILCCVCEGRAAASLPGAARTPGCWPWMKAAATSSSPSPTVGIFPSFQQHSLCLRLPQVLRSMECCCTHGSAQPVLLGGDQLNKAEKITLTVYFSKRKSLFFRCNQALFQSLFHSSLSELSKQPYLQSQLGFITFPGLCL